MSEAAFMPAKLVVQKVWLAGGWQGVQLPLSLKLQQGLEQRSSWSTEAGAGLGPQGFFVRSQAQSNGRTY